MVLTRTSKKSKAKGTRKGAKPKKAVAKPTVETVDSEVESQQDESVDGEIQPESAAAIRARIERDKEVLARLEKAEAVSAKIAELEAERAAVLAGETFSPVKPKRVTFASPPEKLSGKKRGRSPPREEVESSDDSDEELKVDGDADEDDDSSDVGDEAQPPVETPGKALVYKHVMNTWKSESRLESMVLAKPEMCRILRMLKCIPHAARTDQACLRGHVKELQCLYMKYRYNKAAAEQFDVNQKSQSSGGRIDQKAAALAVKQVNLRDQPKNAEGAAPKTPARAPAVPKGPKPQWNKIDNRPSTSSKKGGQASPPRMCYVCGSSSHMAPQCDQRHASTK